MKHSSLRRPGALLVAATVSVAGLTAAPGAASASVSAFVSPMTAPNGPTAGGAAWLAGQLTDGLLVGEFGPDHGLTIDAGLALAAVGGQEAAVASVRNAVARTLDAYISGEAWGDDGSTYAGATAKATVLAQASGGNARSFGGTDLVDRLEDVTADAGPNAGRISDQSKYGDYANTLGQAFAVRALEAAGSAEADAATGFLLAQQCDAGYFRLMFSPEAAADQDCDADPGATPDPDTTALAVLALLTRDGDGAADAAVADAVAWLQQEQAADGGFGGGVSTEAPNTNSTGLAGWALGEAGAADAAARAAAWVAARQAGAIAPCSDEPLAPDLGAIAYDDAALAAGRADGIGGARDQWRRATAQALPALGRLGAAAPSAGRLQVPSGYQRAGSRITVRVAGVGAGETVCVTGPTGSVARTGTGAAALTLPAGTATQTITLRRLGTGASSTVEVLGAKRVGLGLRKKVRRGRTQVVRVRGLAPREKVRVAYRGRSVERGRATSSGRFVARFRASGRAGRARVVVVGQFPNRRNAKFFKVARR